MFQFDTYLKLLYTYNCTIFQIEYIAVDNILLYKYILCHLYQENLFYLKYDNQLRLWR